MDSKVILELYEYHSIAATPFQPILKEPHPTKLVIAVIAINKSHAYSPRGMIYKSTSPLLFIRFYRTLMSTVSPAIDSTSSSFDDAVISSCTEPKEKIENDNSQTSKKPKKYFDFTMLVFNI